MALINRIKFMQVFDKTAKMPSTKDECKGFFIQLVGELSPENLSCDGELSASQVRAKLASIKQEWKELENIYGEKVSEDQVENWMMNRL